MFDTLQKMSKTCQNLTKYFIENTTKKNWTKMRGATGKGCII